VSVVEHDGGATIQTLQPAATVAEVDYRVRVPAGVRFVGRTANGKVEAHGLESPVDAETVNGNIDIETSSSLQARAVNGSITARLSPASDAPPSTLETVNGSVTLALPDRSPASIEATTLYGSINSRGPSFRRDLQRRRNGAPHVHLRTISGNINIFRAASRP
ncbi:MAG: DUF4097 family beta strand repeat protein, partial [Proteobacteria bacterium]|nr:DUF4097 family beta strand repeat protein [Pseudomonadota bacterium]